MEPHAPPVSGQTPEPAAAPQSAGKKILCVEDEHFISELYVRALTKAGYDVTVEIDGQRALDLAKTNQYDIILLDIMVPTITGIEILRRLRDPAETPQLKAKIIVTTNLDQGDAARAEVERQADGYLVKADVTPHELVGVLSSIK